MLFEYAAFLSYSRHDVEWVKVLQQNLEASLKALDHEPWKIFRDETDIGPARSWITCLQQGLDRAPRVVLVATPESVASPRVGDEWEALVARCPDWRQGRIVIVRAIDCPLPPFLKPVQWIDFTQHNDEKYNQGLQELLGALLGHMDRRNLPSPPRGIEVPGPPRRSIPAELRTKIVDWLGKRLQSQLLRHAIAHALGSSAPPLDRHPSWECAASALIVGYTGGDDPVKGLQRMLDVLAAALIEDLPEQVLELKPFREELNKLAEVRGPVGLERLWLKRLVVDHGRLERYFQKEADLDLLAQVYVELHLGGEAAVESSGKSTAGFDSREERNSGKALFHQPQEIEEVLALEADSAAGITGRWVVLGDPGAGKTTLLRNLAASLARKALAADETPRWIPVYESLPVWLREREALPRRLERRLRQTESDANAFAVLVEEWGRTGRLLLLLDGLDEVPRERRDEAEEWIRDLVLHWPTTRIVLTSRPVGYRPPAAGFREVRLLPLDRERRRELLARWLGRRRQELDFVAADEGLAILQSDNSLWQLSGNPLYLTLMAMLIEEGATPDRNRTRLYDQIFSLLLAGKHRPDPVPMDAQEATRGVLRHLAYGMTDENRDAEPRARLEARFLDPSLDRLRDPLYRIPRWHSAPSRFFDDLANRSGILGPHDGEESDWRYWHRTFREALAAEQLEALVKERGLEAVLARAREITNEEDASRWAEPYALLSGRVAEPDRLVRELIDANRSLGLRALASARTIEANTIVTILGLGGDVHERAAIYQELPRQVADGRALLDLVERLRLRIRDGNDLFWLDWIAREVGRRDRDLKTEVDALLERFFDHIPPPAPEAFRKVHTRRNGTVALWCHIPAGRFWMGGESGHETDDGPQHRVEIQSGFQLAAMPVTQGQYAMFDPDHRFNAEDVDWAQHPVTRMSWWAAVSFCRWLSQSLPELKGVRLPTEAEWEYACRAGTKTAYWSGKAESDLNKVGWYRSNSGEQTHPVGELLANPWGLYDVHGNVWEWTISLWPRDYDKVHIEDPATTALEEAVGSDPSANRTIRGGSFGSASERARAASSHGYHPWYQMDDDGLRLARPAASS